jgi:hypothetical protein
MDTTWIFFQFACSTEKKPAVFSQTAHSIWSIFSMTSKTTDLNSRSDNHITQRRILFHATYWAQHRITAQCIFISMREYICMRKCPFCGRWFRNKQAIRAHLRFCPEYLEEKWGSPQECASTSLAFSGFDGPYRWIGSVLFDTNHL